VGWSSPHRKKLRGGRGDRVRYLCGSGSHSHCRELKEKEKGVELFKILTQGEVAEAVFGSGKFNPGTPAIGCLFGGDRLSCIDEGVDLEIQGEIVGLATIAPEGEMHEGQPTIVALYVRHQFRGQGYGRKILMATIDRMRERGLSKPFRADATSSPGFRACQGLSEDYQAVLEVNDMSMGGALDIMMLA